MRGSARKTKTPDCSATRNASLDARKLFEDKISTRNAGRPALGASRAVRADPREGGRRPPWSLSALPATQATARALR
jgi:hypothetical protein